MTNDRTRLIEQITARSRIEGDHLIWEGAVSTTGIPEMFDPDDPAHMIFPRRVLYAAEHPSLDEIPPLRTVCEAGKRCLTPAHQRELAHRQRQTHCKRGHELSPDNVYVGPDGSRKCQTCKRNATYQSQARQAAWGRARVRELEAEVKTLKRQLRQAERTA